MPNVLLLSDNQSFAEDLAGQIKLYAPEFTVYFDEKEAEPVDVYVLDDKSEKVAGLRQNHLKAPIILLEKAEKDNDGNAEREAVISKPFSLNDFLNKLRSCINVFENSSDAYLAFNNYELHPAAKEILNRRNNELIKLTEKEVAVIKYLYKSKDKIVSKNDLLQDVWDYNAEVTTHTIETHLPPAAESGT